MALIVNLEKLESGEVEKITKISRLLVKIRRFDNPDIDQPKMFIDTLIQLINCLPNLHSLRLTTDYIMQNGQTKCSIINKNEILRMSTEQISIFLY